MIRMIRRLLGTVKAVIANKQIRQVIALLVLLLTVSAFILFFSHHPEYWQQLKHISPLVVILVIVGNTLLLGALIGIYRSCIELCGAKIGRRENFLLTAYSSIINFFGPLQSGPGVRAVYLKTKLGIRLRDYTLATLLYYGLFAVINIGFLLAGSRPWWQALLGVTAGVGISYAVIQLFIRRGKRRSAATTFTVSARLIRNLLFFTVLQVCLQTIVFYFELHSINSHISISQAITYTGAADLAIFVSLTPGAIGFRESFLVFSQSLHHIPTSTIVSANLIDRGSYVLFLGILFLVTIGMHARERLHLKRP